MATKFSPPRPYVRLPDPPRRTKDNDPVTAGVLRDALQEHARLTGSGSRLDSYRAFVRDIGSMTLTMAALWWLIGSPGASVVSERYGTASVDHWVDAHPWKLILGALATLAVLAIVTSDRAPRFVHEASWSTWRFVSRLTHTATLLVGLAVISIVGLVPGAFVVHILGLAST